MIANNDVDSAFPDPVTITALITIMSIIGIIQGAGLALDILATARTTRVVLSAAHRNHDTTDNSNANLAAFCQRCHMIHDRPEHVRRGWLTVFRRKALGDLFRGPYG